MKRFFFDLGHGNEERAATMRSLEALPRSKNEATKAGFKYYYTGKPCKHGHYAARLASSCNCTMCNRVRYTSRRKLDSPSKMLSIDASKEDAILTNEIREVWDE